MGIHRFANQPAVLVGVATAIGVERFWSPARSPATTPDRPNRPDQQHELGDIVAIDASQLHLQHVGQ
jgi:hypothetical protein